MPLNLSMWLAAHPAKSRFQATPLHPTHRMPPCFPQLLSRTLTMPTTSQFLLVSALVFRPLLLLPIQKLTRLALALRPLSSILTFHPLLIIALLLQFMTAILLQFSVLVHLACSLAISLTQQLRLTTPFHLTTLFHPNRLSQLTTLISDLGLLDAGGVRPCRHVWMQ